MRFFIGNCELRIEFSFILVLCFATMLGANELLYLLLFSGLHELGHLIVLAICGGRADILTFSFYGLALKYSSQLSRLKEFFVLLAGPLVNLILYIIIRDDINLVLFAINILPIYPLDGGRMLRLFSYRISVIISKMLLVLIVILSIWLIIKFKSFSMLLIAVYLVVYSIMY
ncbi:MAG: hypothetical protein K2H13_03085 [Eubacterium sp.]|nr:hypothetical protein [Eubacterium sp.]